jgi:putative phosphoesterase
MELGVVADTHDNLDVIEAAADRFSAAGVDAVVHCGDVIAPFAAQPFEAFDFYAVRGNNDGEWALRSTVEAFGSYLGEFGELSLDGFEVAVYHGTSEPIVDALLACGHYDCVLRGHTHERVERGRGGTLHLNPGGIGIDPGDPGDPAAVILDTATGDTTFHDLR